MCNGLTVLEADQMLWLASRDIIHFGLNDHPFEQFDDGSLTRITISNNQYDIFFDIETLDDDEQSSLNAAYENFGLAGLIVSVSQKFAVEPPLRHQCDQYTAALNTFESRAVFKDTGICPKRNANLLQLEAIIYLLAQDVAFITPYDEKESDTTNDWCLAIRCNDAFSQVKEGCEAIDPNQAPLLKVIYNQFGESGVLAWIARERGSEPQTELQDTEYINAKLFMGDKGNLMHAAVMLYTIKSAYDVLCFYRRLKEPEPPALPELGGVKDSDLWYWSALRWNTRFTYREYDVRSAYDVKKAKELYPLL